MRILSAVALAFSFMFASAAFAQNDAGCGLGSMVFKDNKKVHQVLAATTNGIGGQTFAISTGTSNCSAQGFVLNEKRIQHFAEANKSDLTREMAQGQGEKLAVLAALYGCNNSDSFGQMTQANYNQIVTSPEMNSVEMVNNLNSQVANNTALAQSCSL